MLPLSVTVAWPGVPAVTVKAPLTPQLLPLRKVSLAADNTGATSEPLRATPQTVPLTLALALPAPSRLSEASCRTGGPWDW